MILTLDIHKEVPGIYTARLLNTGALVTDPREYHSIEAAIAGEASDVPNGFAHFIEVRYNGFSSGTELIEAVAGRATSIADRLVALVAEGHRLERQ
ncbi:hypothetical protein [Variovorax sp. 38R]|uniref:hypothetical protein n=1 Tax=Variovorax sp. 38R TaxID=2774875 RepID=UPI00177C5F9B|nr:hypothetical protein [Variovorax sp. 38R]QOF76082.1 hypothetical protein IG196_16870 [Variovorax sp. 38R]